MSANSKSFPAKNKRVLRFPVSAIALELRRLHREFERVSGTERDDDDYLTGETLEVRLQIFPDGTWSVHFGDVGYDTDHRGAWGSSEIDLTVRFNVADSQAMARALINEAADMAAQDPDFSLPIAYALTRREKATMYHTAVQRLIHGDLLDRT